MNKTLIALAIAAALPVAAQADVTLSGSVTAEYTQGGVMTTDAAFGLAASEVLANGMTATASLDVLGDDTQGTASLAGDFGTLTVGSIDSDGAFQAGDVGGAVGDSTDADEDSTSVQGVHFSSSVASLNIAGQFNASTEADGTTADTAGSQVSASYDLDGLSVGYAYATAGASTDTVDGLMAAQSAFGASYTFGDLVLSAGKSSIVADAVISATYTMSMDALTIKAQVDNDPAGDYQVNVTYAVSDEISVNAEFDKSAANTIMGASYTSGSLTATVTKTDDAAGSTDASVALDYGNADVTLARDGGAQTTSLTYSVAF